MGGSPSGRPTDAGVKVVIACSLVFVASCAEPLPTRSSDRADAAAEGAPANLVDAGEASIDSALAESGAPMDDSSVDAAADDADGGVTDAPSSRLFDADASPADAVAIGPIGPCNAIIEAHPIEGFLHVAICSHVAYATKPPSSGDHYPVWAAYKSYASAIPEGFWVHNLEHGTVVVSYNCPAGCTADVAAAQAWIDALPNDPVCNRDAGEARVRVVMTPDPHLDVKFAASAWGWTLRADCFDPTAWTAFYQSHYDQGREVSCAQGMDFSLGVQDGCGE